MKNGTSIVTKFLDKFPYDEMSDDVRACKDALKAWKSGESHIPVRNFRSLAVATDMLIKQGWDKNKRELLMGKELRNRVLYDENSSQKVSAIILTMNDNVMEDRILKRDSIDKLIPQIQNAIVVKNIYKDMRVVQSTTIYKEDETISRHFNYYIAKLCGKDVKLEIKSAEDIPLAYMMNEIELSEAEKRFPSLRNHETDRIRELEYQKRRLYIKPSIYSTDHRVVMACAMANNLQEGDFKKIGYDYSVNKSFPKFWEMLEEINKIYNDNW